MKVKKMHPDAVLPKYANKFDSGFDLVAVENTIIKPRETKLIKTGLAFDIPEGFEIQVRPRSGITLKTKLRVQLGTIDSNYRGEVGVIVDNISEETGIVIKENYDACRVFTVKNETEHVFGDYDGLSYLIQKGDRIAQGVLSPVAHTEIEEVDKISDTERGTNGYGSTGVN